MRFQEGEPRPGIIGAGSAYPRRVFSNADVANAINRSRDGVNRMAGRIGVKERHWVELGGEVATSDLAITAIQKALVSAGISANKLVLISVGTSSPDHIASPDAPVVQHALGIPTNVRALDLGNNACVGFLHAIGNSIIELTSRARKSGPHAIAGVEIMTPISRTAKPGIATMFGDGGGAVIVDNFTPPKDAPKGIGMAFGADGSHALDLYIPAGGSRKPTTMETVRNNEHTIYMNGDIVRDNAILRMSEIALEAILDAGMTPDDVNWFLPHQANMEIVNGVIDTLNLDRRRVLVNIGRRGNMSAGSIPSVLADNVESGVIKPYDFVLAIAFGAGFNYGAVGMPYAGPQRST
ncbi:MAG: hypothetical protein ACD_37C00603G0009 [uncultured bacterium]|nr:MAG: hypothetical protein ACD_37C00603G0009 [uncultured bacterium]